jgi:hypothetical protein
MEELGTSSAFGEHTHRPLIYGAFYGVPMQHLQDPTVLYNTEQDRAPIKTVCACLENDVTEMDSRHHQVGQVI